MIKVKKKQVDISFKGERVTGIFTKGQFTKKIQKIMGDKDMGAEQASYLWKNLKSKNTNGEM